VPGIVLCCRVKYPRLMKLAGSGAAAPDAVLDSWKAIAQYLRRDIRTVMRWERERGLPVRRLPGGGKPGVYALTSDLDAWWKGTGKQAGEAAERAVARTAGPSVAVLPLANVSADRENEFFCDGLTDGIILALTRVEGLRVTARTSSFAFRGKCEDVRRIGEALGVGTVLEGSVQRSKDRIRVTVQLTGVGDGFQLWSELYERGAGEAFAIQDEIAQAIAAALRVRLAPAPASPQRRGSPGAFSLRMRGHCYQQYESPEALARCRMCLERAIALDPGAAPLYIGLAEVCRTVADFGAVRARDVLAQGRAAVWKALELDEAAGEAHAISGAYRAWMDFDWTGAATDFDRALKLLPGSELVHRLRAIHYLVPTGRLKEAEDELALAIESDPLSPLTYVELGKVLLWTRQFDRAQAEIDAALELRPGYALAVCYRGLGLYLQGRIGAALDSWQSATGNSPASIGATGMMLAKLGRAEEARVALAALEAMERERYVPPVSRAKICLGLGETGAALKWLERAVEERTPDILDIPCNPLWDGLRQDPRFGALLREMRLE
jgi:TolB-like protein/Tfp pilus assembly protein PilF